MYVWKRMGDNIQMFTLHDLLTLMHAIVDFPILCTVFLFHSLGIGDRVPNGEHIKIETTEKNEHTISKKIVTRIYVVLENQTLAYMLLNRFGYYDVAIVLFLLKK